MSALDTSQQHNINACLQVIKAAGLEIDTLQEFHGCESARVCIRRYNTFTLEQFRCIARMKNWKCVCFFALLTERRCLLDMHWLHLLEELPGIKRQFYLVSS